MTILSKVVGGSRVMKGWMPLKELLCLRKNGRNSDTRYRLRISKMGRWEAEDNLDMSGRNKTLTMDEADNMKKGRIALIWTGCEIMERDEEKLRRKALGCLEREGTEGREAVKESLNSVETLHKRPNMERK
jgi:hypothetical protein